MKQFRKLIISIVGSFLLLIGIFMIVLPGPAVIFIPLALYVLNSQYPNKTRSYIRKFQRGISNGAAWLDEKFR